MLQAIGVSSVEALFADIPDEVRFKGKLNLPGGLAEGPLLAHVGALARKNRSADELVCFAGGGAYDHLIPSAVRTVVSRNEFYTAYTPYQAEISQGVLQTIFEFQTLICQLTALDIANASMYDGASALAEAAIMACAHTNRGRVLVAGSCYPEYRTVVRTYLEPQGVKVDVVPCKEGVLDLAALQDALSADVACLILQHPNFFGHLEPARAAGEAVHRAGGLFVVSADPISLGLLEPPGVYGADIAAGEGQPLGNALSFGGPYLGYLAAKEALIRRIPGRIVGQTKDTEGRRGFVLTLQAREQHIRRQRAQSNICTNQALNALAAAAYLVLVGKEGLREAAAQSFHKAHYMERELLKTGKVERLAKQPFFKEFAAVANEPLDVLEKRLLEAGLFAGPRFDKLGLAPENGLMFCATEARTKEEIDRLVRAVAAG